MAGKLTAVIECFSCTVTETIWLGDLFKTSDLTSLLHSISQGSICELLLQGNLNPICFIYCLAKHKSIQNFIFKFEFLLSESLQNAKVIQIFRTVYHHSSVEKSLNT